MSDKAVRVGRRDLFREAIRAEKRRMLALVLSESGWPNKVFSQVASEAG